jgi:hypothetical protein
MADGPSCSSASRMLGRAVALVRGEADTRVGLVERDHHAVALGLGDDRGRGNAEVDAVPLVEHVLRDFDAGHRCARRPERAEACSGSASTARRNREQRRV